ncbi:hypothetical protein BX666DRAFT_2025006 [Dichotomocladium elegans]|nr:hypothetical protein BX666DRAFT_2025006 [Dichotomocladium elegans]
MVSSTGALMVLHVLVDVNIHFLAASPSRRTCYGVASPSSYRGTIGVHPPPKGPRKDTSGPLRDCWTTQVDVR